MAWLWLSRCLLTASLSACGVCVCVVQVAVEAMSDALRRELLPLGVSVSVIEPAFVKSPMQDKATASDQVLTQLGSQGQVLRCCMG